MPFGGSAPNKVYTRTDGVRSGAAVCTQAKNASVNDTSELSDVREQDLADAINLLVMRDGGNQPSAALPMNGYNHTNVGVATARTHYARASQVQDSSLIFGGTAGGTANALTLDLSPSITSYTAGLMILFKASADNTDDDVTVNVDGVGDATLFKFDGATKPAVGDIQNGGMYIIIHDGTNFCLVGAVGPKLTALAALTMASGTVPVSNGSEGFTAVLRTNLGLEATTKAVFWQTSAPTGWTKDTNHNDKALRITSGTASTGGSVAFETAFASQGVAGTVGNTTLTVNQIPSHGHPFRISVNGGNDSEVSGALMVSLNDQTNFSAFTGTPSGTNGQQIGGTGGGESHTHTFTGTAINLDVAFVDVILATKD